MEWLSRAGPVKSPLPEHEHEDVSLSDAARGGGLRRFPNLAWPIRNPFSNHYGKSESPGSIIAPRLAAPRDANRLGTRFDSKFVPVIVDESKSGRRRREG